MSKIDWDKAVALRRKTRRSYRDIRDAARKAQGKTHDKQSGNLRFTSNYAFKRIQEATGATPAQIEKWAESRMRNR